MAKNDTIELQQPLGYTGSGSSTSVAAKEDVAHYHGNENDQADMNRLGKKQRLDVCWKMIRALPLHPRLTVTAQLLFALRPWPYLCPHGDVGDHVHVKSLAVAGGLTCTNNVVAQRALANSTAVELYGNLNGTLIQAGR